MDAAEFADRLGELSSTDIRDIAAALQLQLGTAEGEVAWWKATIAIEIALKRQRHSRVAGRAAWVAAHALLEAAEREGLLPAEKDLVTLVARAASDVARGLVAGGAASVSLAPLTNVWRPVFVPAVA
jgi:hypothetical protein